MENHARIKNKIHYAWVVCIMGTLLIFVTMGTVSNGFSIFLPYIMKEQGLSHAQTSSLVTLRCLVSFFAMLGIGFYYKRFSLRAGNGIAAICGAASFAIYAAARSYPAFCAGAAVSGLCYGLGSMIPVSVLMHNWFRKSQALALGICAAGSGIATIALPTISTALVEHYSLRDAFVIECVGIVALSAVIILFLRGSSADKGLRPYGYEEGENEERRASPGARAEAPAADADTDTEQPAARTLGLSGRVWLMMGLTSLFMGALANPGFSHLSVLFRTEGFRPMTVALMISVCGLMITLGKIVYGRTTDKIGGLRSSLIFGGLLAAGHIICCFSFVGNEAL